MTLSVSVRHHFPGFDLEAQLEVPNGVTALFGPSGSGKTTIINAIAGLLSPHEANIRVGKTVLQDTDDNVSLPVHRRQIGYVFQEPRLFPHMTVRQNLDYGTRFRTSTVSPVNRGEILERFGIGHLIDRMPANLSGGEKQRVALGRALLSSPSILLLDEPLAALDDERKREIIPYLEAIRDTADIPILYVSHSAAEVARLSDRIAVLSDGRIIATGETDAVFSDPDVWPDMGIREAGSLLRGTITSYADDGLAAVSLSGGTVHLPSISGPVGAAVTLRISAHDVIIATEPPSGLSALNVLPATVSAIRAGQGPGVIVSLAIGDDTLLARITRRSADALKLQLGLACHAIMKSVGVAPLDIGRQPK